MVGPVGIAEGSFPNHYRRTREEPVGFEPTRRVNAFLLSRQVQSTRLCHGSSSSGWNRTSGGFGYEPNVGTSALAAE